MGDWMKNGISQVSKDYVAEQNGWLGLGLCEGFKSIVCSDKVSTWGGF